jgi:hypothetical protein
MALRSRLSRPGRTVSRRQFLRGAGATACSGLLARESLAAPYQAHKKIPPRERVAPPIRIGSDEGASLEVIKTSDGYSFGAISYRGQLVETPMRDGIILFVGKGGREKNWFFGSQSDIQDQQSLRLTGEGKIREARVRYSLDLAIPPASQSLRMIYRFAFDRDVSALQAHLMFFTIFSHRWTCHIYPWAENAKSLSVAPLRYMGIPSVFLYRDDLSFGFLYGLDPNSDYLDPTAWTRNFAASFEDQKITPQWRVGGGIFRGGSTYTCPVQVVVTNERSPSRMIAELVREWRTLNGYSVEALHVRSDDEALRLFISGREKTSLWFEGMGYQIQDGPDGAFITMADQGLNAYFDYLVFEMTGERLWRDRSFQQAEFLLKAQHADPSDRNLGAFESNYDLVRRTFNSFDRGSNRGLKPDLNMRAAQFLLLLWDQLRTREGRDIPVWQQAALRSVDWVIRHQNPDGGNPQKLEPGTNSPSQSVTPGRALAALPDILRIARSEKYRKFMEELEEWTYINNDRKFHFFGAHPDLPPPELEESSIWNIAYYNLQRYEQTRKSTYLERAVGEVSLAFTWNCPKQLSWVQNPTQMASSEQRDYLQYSVYNYEDMKTAALYKLWQFTGERLYLDLFRRVSQNIYFTQVTKGNDLGGMYERIADPWLARTDVAGQPSFDSMGSVYMGQLGVDYFYQLLLLRKLGRHIARG